MGGALNRPESPQNPGRFIAPASKGFVSASTTPLGWADMGARRLLPLILILSAAACTADSAVVNQASDGRFRMAVADDIHVWHNVDRSFAFLAVVSGRFRYDDECGAYLESGPSDAHAVVWPEGTTVTDSEPVTLQLPDGTTVAEGQTVSGSGGYFRGLGLFREQCARSGQTAVFNASESVTVRGIPPPPAG